MIHIRTWSEAQSALDRLPAPCLRLPLQAHLDRLREYDDYDLPDLAEFVIIQDTDRPEDAERLLDRLLVDRETGTFVTDPEYALRHDDWLELVFVLSDDGFGLVLFVQVTSRTNPELATACNSIDTSNQ